MEPQDAALSFNDPAWMTAKRGLINYRRAVIAKVIIAVAFGVLLVGAAMSRSIGAIKVITLLVVGLSLFTTIWSLTGLVGYSKVPESTGGKGTASAAVAFAGLGLVFELFGVYFVYCLFSDDLSTLLSVAKYAPYSEVASLVLGLVGLLFLLSSFKSVAIHVGDGGVAERVGTVVTMVIVLAVLYCVLKLGGEHLGGLGLLVGLGVLVMAIIVLIAFLRLLRDLGNAIGGLDVARVFE